MIMKGGVHVLVALGLLVFISTSHCASHKEKRGSSNEAETETNGYLRRLSSLFYRKLKEKLTNVFYTTATQTNTQVRFKRQQQQRVKVERFICADQTDCVPPEFDWFDVPLSFINCSSDGFCICSDCFMRLNDTCALRQCHDYLVTQQLCIDHHKSQKTALLLSIFLSATGAANFYVRQYLLAGVQLGLLVLTIVLVCCVVCVPCCALSFFEDEFEDILDSCCFLIFVVSSICLSVCLVMVMAVWWMADLTYFVQNARVDGVTNCPLRADL